MKFFENYPRRIDFARDYVYTSTTRLRNFIEIFTDINLYNLMMQPQDLRQIFTKLTRQQENFQTKKK